MRTAFPCWTAAAAALFLAGCPLVPDLCDVRCEGKEGDDYNACMDACDPPPPDKGPGAESDVGAGGDGGEP